MNAKKIDEYIALATALTKSRILDAENSFGLGSNFDFDLDLLNSKIVFSNAKGQANCTASVIPIGSWAKLAQTWLWSWENESIPKQVSAPMEPVKLFGDQHEISALQHTFSPCDEAMAWALASISLKILDAQCVYRVDRGKNLLFLLLNDIKLAH